eukprot:TRINITY_DN20185_c0_g1_i1.p1 TRINITY_DN20185_c0_g1~~TRINITY_DN20185_c0_g1_i1.p1  ORF type:complete len:394 (-),score=44.54 TRINITY_DN20185_c0_g1_i1:175-1233(-)
MALGDAAAAGHGGSSPPRRLRASSSETSESASSSSSGLAERFLESTVRSAEAAVRVEQFVLPKRVRPGSRIKSTCWGSTADSLGDVGGADCADAQDGAEAALAAAACALGALRDHDGLSEAGEEAESVVTAPGANAAGGGASAEDHFGAWLLSRETQPLPLPPQPRALLPATNAWGFGSRDHQGGRRSLAGRVPDPRSPRAPSTRCMTAGATTAAKRRRSLPPACPSLTRRRLLPSASGFRCRTLQVPQSPRLPGARCSRWAALAPRAGESRTCSRCGRSCGLVATEGRRRLRRHLEHEVGREVDSPRAFFLIRSRRWNCLASNWRCQTDRTPTAMTDNAVVPNAVCDRSAT